MAGGHLVFQPPTFDWLQRTSNLHLQSRHNVHNVPKFQPPTSSSTKVITKSVHFWLLSRPLLNFLSGPSYCAKYWVIHICHMSGKGKYMYKFPFETLVCDQCTRLAIRHKQNAIFDYFKTLDFSLFPAQWQVDSLYFSHPHLTGMQRTSNLHLQSGKAKLS